MIPIIEQTPGSADTATVSEQKRYRRWSVIAGSRAQAAAMLQGQLGIQLYCRYSDPQGVLGPANLILQQLTIVGRPEAPIGGTSQHIVDAEYSTQTSQARPQMGGRWVWTPRPTLGSGPIDLDAAGLPIVTSSWEPVDPPLSALRPEEILHGEKYFAGASELEVYTPLRVYNGTLNASTIFGAARGSLLLHVFQTQPSDSGWVLVSVDLQYRKPWVYQGQSYEGWQEVFQDKGTRKVVDKSKSDPKQRFQNITIPDDSGTQRRVDHPVPLDGKGGVLSPDAAPVYIVVNKYTYAELNNILGD